MRQGAHDGFDLIPGHNHRMVFCLSNAGQGIEFATFSIQEILIIGEYHLFLSSVKILLNSRALVKRARCPSFR